MTQAPKLFIRYATFAAHTACARTAAAGCVRGWAPRRQPWIGNFREELPAPPRPTPPRDVDIYRSTIPRTSPPSLPRTRWPSGGRCDAWNFASSRTSTCTTAGTHAIYVSHVCTRCAATPFVTPRARRWRASARHGGAPAASCETRAPPSPRASVDRPWTAPRLSRTGAAASSFCRHRRGRAGSVPFISVVMGENAAVAQAAR